MAPFILYSVVVLQTQQVSYHLKYIIPDLLYLVFTCFATFMIPSVTQLLGNSLELCGGVELDGDHVKVFQRRVRSIKVNVMSFLGGSVVLIVMFLFRMGNHCKEVYFSFTNAILMSGIFLISFFCFPSALLFAFCITISRLLLLSVPNPQKAGMKNSKVFEVARKGGCILLLMVVFLILFLYEHMEDILRDWMC